MRLWTRESDRREIDKFDLCVCVCVCVGGGGMGEGRMSV